MKHLIIVVTTLLAFGCATSSGPRQSENARLAADLFGMKFDSATKSITAENFTGLKKGDLLFSRRTDSRTYFMYDQAASRRSAPLFAGNDEELLQRARVILSRVEVPAGEIARARVLQEELGIASVDRVSHAITNRKISKGKRYALVTREVDGIPVFSSRLLLTVGGDGRPSFAELHWPVIPAGVIEEGKRLQSRVREGWKPPEVAGARLQSVEAGILHSPAPATVMDIRAVIRVIYAPENPRVSVKEQRFFDGEGRVIEPPRTFAKMPEISNRDKSRLKPVSKP